MSHKENLKNMAEEGVGINGFGRVGQMFLRMALERELRVVAINDPEVGVDLMGSMLQRDSTQGVCTYRISFLFLQVLGMVRWQ